MADLAPDQSRLPWFVGEPQPANELGWHVRDANGLLLFEVEYPGDEGMEMAMLIASAINFIGDEVCAHCGKPAACFGSYKDELHPAYACNDCCGHGNEDGHCDPVESLEIEFKEGGSCLGSEMLHNGSVLMVMQMVPKNISPEPGAQLAEQVKALKTITARMEATLAALRSAQSNSWRA